MFSMKQHDTQLFSRSQLGSNPQTWSNLDKTWDDQIWQLLSCNDIVFSCFLSMNILGVSCHNLWGAYYVWKLVDHHMFQTLIARTNRDQYRQSDHRSEISPQLSMTLAIHIYRVIHCTSTILLATYESYISYISSYHIYYQTMYPCVGSVLFPQCWGSVVGRMVWSSLKRRQRRCESGWGVSFWTIKKGHWLPRKYDISWYNIYI